MVIKILFRCFDAPVFALRNLLTAALVMTWLIVPPAGAESCNLSAFLFRAKANERADSGLPIPTQREPAPIELDVLTTDLLKWIGDQTGYDVSASLRDPPGINFCDKGMTIEYEDQDLTISTETPLRGAYDQRQRRIHLVRPWDASSIRDQSSLLHELVHDVQYLNADWECEAEPEWEAYRLQEAWLAEHGVQSGFNWTYIYLRSRCRRDTHP